MGFQYVLIYFLCPYLQGYTACSSVPVLLSHSSLLQVKEVWSGCCLLFVWSSVPPPHLPLCSPSQVERARFQCRGVLRHKLPRLLGEAALVLGLPAGHHLPPHVQLWGGGKAMVGRGWRRGRGKGRGRGGLVMCVGFI